MSQAFSLTKLARLFSAGNYGNSISVDSNGNPMVSNNLKTTVALADAAATLTAAQLVGSGIFTITPTVARILTTDTAANIVAALPQYRVGTWFAFSIGNLAAFDVTLAAGTGVTLSGKMIVNNAGGMWWARIDSATAVTISSTAVASVAGSATQAFSASTFTGALNGNATTASSAVKLAGASAYTNGTDGWFRSDGAAGWYSTTYAVGIYATESGNIRTYNNANFITNGLYCAGTFGSTNTASGAMINTNNVGYLHLGGWAIGRTAANAVMVNTAYMADTLANSPGSAPHYACRAWVNFDGTGIVAIRASGNVSSITDNGVGDYTVNFTTAMPTANYGINTTSGGNAGNSFGFSSIFDASTAGPGVDPTTTAFRVRTTNLNLLF